jgi:triacylglycerol lipase
MTALPTLFVHGIWDSAARVAPLRQGLEMRGVSNVHAFDLVPNTGSATIPELAVQVQAAAEKLGGARFDLVGFSMGALISRYYLQRLGGLKRVRRFISISGPHAGTLTAYALPFLRGVQQMRPNSALLQDLARDEHPFGAVDVHTLTTPFDLMIVPSTSAELRGSKSHKSFPVKMHRWMITDARVLDHVAQLLLAAD